MVVLPGTTHPLVAAAADRGRIPPVTPMKRILLALRRRACGFTPSECQS